MNLRERQQVLQIEYPGWLIQDSRESLMLKLRAH